VGNPLKILNSDGWCVTSFFLVSDDAMDDSVTRSGQPHWCRLPEVKLIAINDSEKYHLGL